jgi:hypothetical protein
MIKDDTIKSRLTPINEKVNILSDYVQVNLLAFQYLRNKNYSSAKKSFKECINLAKQLDEMDELKHVESLTNYGICQYFCGKFIDANTTLECAHEISKRLYDNLLSNDKNIK